MVKSEKVKMSVSKFVICSAILLSIESTTGHSETQNLQEKIVEDTFTTESTAVATTQSHRSRRWYKGDDEHGDIHPDDYEEMNSDQDKGKAVAHGKIDYWGGYYDFLINEGSYKFWAVFQLATAALLIYSGFAALYYAKVNPSTNDDYDYFDRRRRRRRRDVFLGLQPQTFLRIIEAVDRDFRQNPS